jgi:eukaryotic-like serine/threonine-protein kinase
MADTGQIIGGYKLRGLLHTGRDSQVWEVVEPTSNRHFAMKLLLPEFAQSKPERAKLFNDADIGKQLRHECVVNIAKVNKSQNQPHFIMEYFAAGSLRRRLQSRDPKDKDYLKQYAKKIFKQTATGLAYMNASGFVHLDVKPDNIVANASGQTKIIDFAISRPIRKGFIANLFRKKGPPEGTPTYMSPEQIRTELLDGRSDIYSLGITWYEVVCGRPPFRGNSVGDLYRKHFSEKPQLPSAYNPDVTEEFGQLLLRMVAKNRKDRPESFHNVLIDLRKTQVFKSMKEDEEEMNMGMMG